MIALVSIVVTLLAIGGGLTWFAFTHWPLFSTIVTVVVLILLAAALYVLVPAVVRALLNIRF